MFCLQFIGENQMKKREKQNFHVFYNTLSTRYDNMRIWSVVVFDSLNIVFHNGAWLMCVIYVYVIHSTYHNKFSTIYPDIFEHAVALSNTHIVITFLIYFRSFFFGCCCCSPFSQSVNMYFCFPRSKDFYFHLNSLENIRTFYWNVRDLLVSQLVWNIIIIIM